eukprot:5501502-Prorocentrum_lima.AAC.1
MDDVQGLLTGLRDQGCRTAKALVKEWTCTVKGLGMTLNTTKTAVRCDGAATSKRLKHIAPEMGEALCRSTR